MLKLDLKQGSLLLNFKLNENEAGTFMPITCFKMMKINLAVRYIFIDLFSCGLNKRSIVRNGFWHILQVSKGCLKHTPTKKCLQETACMVLRWNTKIGRLLNARK